MDQTQRINYIVDLLLDADKSTEDNDNNIHTILYDMKNEIISANSEDYLQDEVRHILLDTISKCYAHEEIHWGLVAASLSEYL